MWRGPIFVEPKMMVKGGSVQLRLGDLVWVSGHAGTEMAGMEMSQIIEILENQNSL